jgi:hypothetical protein
MDNSADNPHGPADTLELLLEEYDLARAHSLALVGDLDADQIAWRPNDNSSAIAWHLGHQGAVNHYMVRNLTAAEVSFDAGFDAVFDSATPEPERGDLPPVSEIVTYRELIAESTHRVIARIARGDVGAPAQLNRIADGLLRAVINHEYQHSTWIREVHDSLVGTPAPEPTSRRLVTVEGYAMLADG